MIYVMSDIHGMYDKYQEMINLIDLKDDDTLYIIGDVVDRGNGSIKILKDMMNRPNVNAIIGNHELMMVNCIRWINQEISDELLNHVNDEKLMDLTDWITNGGFSTIEEFKKLTKEEKNDIIDYIMDFTAYEEVSVNDKDYILVHAGLGNFREDKLLDDYDINELVWERPNLDVPYFNDPNLYVIVGHTPTLGITGKPEIIHKNNIINIDCGACYKEGKLACLCLDTMEEFYV